MRHKITLCLAALLLAAPAWPKEAGKAGGYANAASVVATAMGVDLNTALEARGLDLDELLGWIIMRMSEHCKCKPASLMDKRASLSWGEIAESAGTDWETVVDETLERAKSAGISPQIPTQEQERRGLVNAPEKNDDGGRQ